MPKKFQNKYRIESARLQNWDYRWNAAYFVTICTANRECYFGDIVKGDMQLSQQGVLADVLWHQITRNTENVELGEFVIMPNHIHGIVIINNSLNSNKSSNTKNNSIDNVDSNVSVDLDGTVETLHATSLQNQPQRQPKNEQKASISPKSGSLSVIIRSYKSAVTKHANRLGFDFGWQTRFHDHIIRNDESFNRISEYIINNPENWKEDRFYE